MPGIFNLDCQVEDGGKIGVGLQCGIGNMDVDLGQYMGDVIQQMPGIESANDYWHGVAGL